MDQDQKDDLFREKLGNFAREPDPHVWERIERSLNKKKSRRLLPLWWSLGGAAALVLLGLFLIGPWDGGESQTLPVTDTEQQRSGPLQQMETDSAAPDRAVAPEGIADTRSETSSPANRQEVTGSSADEGKQRETPKNKSSVPRAAQQVAVAVAGDEKPNPADVGNSKSDPREEQAPRPASDNDGRVRPEIRTPESAVAENMEQAGEEEVQPREKEAGKSIFEAIAESESEVAETRASGRWSVGTSVAPVYYNSFGSGSPISPNFVSNSKSGTLNLSFGLSVSYDVSSRISVRSGINKVDFGYNTNEVAFTSTLDAAPSSLIRTISYSEDAKNVVVGSMAQDNNLSSQTMSADVAAQSPAREGRMLQQFGYLEVPLEMEYRLIDRKLGLNLVGGLSSLFLVDNSVSLDSSGASTQIGEATNMNAVSFSTNVGLGVSYMLNTSLQLQMQPMFKYHMNAFTETAGDFRPYSIGVYSGIRYRF